MRFGVNEFVRTQLQVYCFRNSIHGVLKSSNVALKLSYKRLTLTRSRATMRTPICLYLVIYKRHFTDYAEQSPTELVQQQSMPRHHYQQSREIIHSNLMEKKHSPSGDFHRAYATHVELTQFRQTLKDATCLRH